MRLRFDTILKIANVVLRPIFTLLNGRKARDDVPFNFPFTSNGDLISDFDDGGAKYIVGLGRRGLDFVTHAPRLAKLLRLEPFVEVFPTAGLMSPEKAGKFGSKLPANSFIALKSNGEIEVELSGTDTREGLLNHPGKVHFVASKEGNLSFRSIGQFSDLHLSQPSSISDSSQDDNVLFLFVDGLAWRFFDNEELSSTMPNVGSFFKARGYVSDKFYSVSNWTLPSFASIFTGLRPNEHGLWHPSLQVSLGPSITTIAQVAESQGYLTSQFNGNHRITPTYGYARGFQRVAYERSASAETLTSELTDWFSALPRRRHFSFLSLFDIHRPWPGGIPSPGLAIASEFSYLSTLEKSGTKSVFARPNRDLALTYREVVRRLDSTIGRLIGFFDSLERPTKIILVTDHGQSYFMNQESPLDSQRIHVPFAVGSTGGKEDIDVQPLAEGVLQSDDVFDIVSSLLGSQAKRQRSFIRNQELFISENIFPGQPYLMRVGDSRSWVEFASSKNLEEASTLGRLELARTNMSLGCSEEFERVASEEMLRRLHSLRNI